MSRIVLLLAGVALAHPASAQGTPRTIATVTGAADVPVAVPYDSSFVRRLRVPPEFRVTVFAAHLGTARMLAVGDDGTVYVTRRDSGDVLALRDGGAGRIAVPRKVLANLPRVHGIALDKNRLYVATVRDVFVGDARGDQPVSGLRQIVDDLPDGGQHPNRTIAIGPDSMLYISVGSTCNRCVETNPESATLLRARPDGASRGIFASGLRNTVGWAWHPETRELWGMDHGSDWSGNDVPPEELNKLQSASHYGWPFCYGNRVVDSAYIGVPDGNTRESFCSRTVSPALIYQAHSAPIQLVFYDGRQFPAAYRGDAFVTMRGSWNRTPPTGYKVVRIRYENGQPAAREDFLTGFLSEDGRRHYGRLAGMAVARDGSLLVADDANGVIYRVSHGTGAASASASAAAADSSRLTTRAAAGEVARDSATVRSAGAPPDSARPERIAYVDSLAQPESVVHDSTRNVYYVSNIAGSSTGKDGNGFISRLTADGARDSVRWIAGGSNGVTLHAPKGMALVGDTLWVSDIDAVRALSVTTGRVVASIDLAPLGATFLNDVAIGPEGSVYVTDTRMRTDARGNRVDAGVDRVFVIDRNRRPSVALETDRLAQPNGIAWQGAQNRFVIVPFGGDTIMAWRPGEAAPTPLAVGPGQFDGVVVTPDGRLLVSSKATRGVHEVRGDSTVQVIKQVGDVADIVWNRARSILAIPLTGQNRVEFYRLPP